MGRIGQKVGSLVVVLSAFSNATLDHILEPCVVMRDNSHSGGELCRYELDARREETSGCKAVVMCRLFRNARGAAWQVEAIGAVHEFGDADDYTPIVVSLEQQFKRQLGSGSGGGAGNSQGTTTTVEKFTDNETW